MSGAVLLELQGLWVAERRWFVLHELSLELRAGERLVVLDGVDGGAGALFRALTLGRGVVDGRILLGGTDITGLAPSARREAGLAAVDRAALILPQLTVEEQLRLYLPPGREGRARLEQLYALLPELRERRRQTTRRLDPELRYLLASGCALARAPLVWVLDHPLTLLARERLARLFADSAPLAQAVLWIEREPLRALPLASRGVLLLRGRAVRGGRPEALRDDHRVLDACRGDPFAFG